MEWVKGPECSIVSSASDERVRVVKLLEGPAVIGDGLEVRASEVGKNAGNGLFATREFKRKEIITEYDGHYICHRQALIRRRNRTDTHVRTVRHGHCYIAGLKTPIQGRGGASFCNDRAVVDGMFSFTENRHNNAVFKYIADRWTGQEHVVLRALRDIAPGEEIYVGYGAGYWKRL